MDKSKKVIFNEFIDSSEGEEDAELGKSMLPSLELLLTKPINTEKYNFYFIWVNSTIALVQKIYRVKTMNYIEHTVRNYIENDFIMHFRLSREIAYRLIYKFEQSPGFVSLQSEFGKQVLSGEHHILTYLWFLGHESASYRDVADKFGITLSTLFKVITRVTEYLLNIASNVIRFPTFAERRATEEYYRVHKKFPGVIGSIDGSHIRILKPQQDPDSYINRKKYYSIQIQAVVDHNKKFLDVFLGYPGSVHDARVFRESDLFDSLNELCDVGTYMLGDSAYPCLPQLIVPYKENYRRNQQLTAAQKKFNKRLSSVRVAVEHAFGALKQRFRILYGMKLKNMVRIVKIIHAACVLHNFANADDLNIMEPPENDKLPVLELVNRDIVEEIEVAQHDVNGFLLRDEICRQVATM